MFSVRGFEEHWIAVKIGFNVEMIVCFYASFCWDQCHHIITQGCAGMCRTSSKVDSKEWWHVKCHKTRQRENMNKKLFVFSYGSHCFENLFMSSIYIVMVHIILRNFFHNVFSLYYYCALFWETHNVVCFYCNGAYYFENHLPYCWLSLMLWCPSFWETSFNFSLGHHHFEQLLSAFSW